MTWLKILVGTGAALALSACGGKVIFDDGGEGGSTSTSVTTASTTSHAATTSSGGNSCASLLADLKAKTATAQSCNPFLDIQQCDGTALLNDQCGCASVLANEHDPQRVQAANAAYQAWVAAGCGPQNCKQCNTAFPGFCSGTTEADGICVSAVF